MARGSKIACICLLALLVPALASSNGVASRDPVSISALAPADEYFGHEKLSPFVIRHKIFALKNDLHHARMHPDAIAHDAQLVEDALRDWTGRFPQDPWLPATAWNLATLYEELPGTDAHARALATLQFVRDRFSDTPYAEYASRDLSRGVGVRPWPKWAGSPVVPQSPSSTPSAHPTPSPLTTGSPLATPSLSAMPSPSPMVAETPNSAPSLVDAIRAQRDTAAAQTLENKYWSLSKNGTDPAYARAAWEMAVLYERLPGEDSRKRAIRFLALLVDRYSSLVYGRWAMRDLERGLGVR